MMATHVTGLVHNAIAQNASMDLAQLWSPSHLPTSPSKSTLSVSTISATTPGVSPRLTASLNCLDSAALPASESPCDPARSPLRVSCLFVWAETVQIGHPADVTNRVIPRAVVRNFMAPILHLSEKIEMVRAALKSWALPKSEGPNCL